MTREIGQEDPSVFQNDISVKRRGLLKFGTVISAFTSASALATLGASTAQAAPAAPGDKYVPMAEKGAPSGVAALDANSKIPPAQLPDLSATYSKRSFVDVEDFRNLSGADASDDVCIQAAITYASANTIPLVKLTRKAYTIRKQINMAGVYRVCVEGLGRDQTVITVPGTLADINVALGSAFTATGSAGGCGGLTFRNFTVQGTIVDDTNGVPRRSRTKAGGAGVSQAFTFRGDLTPQSTGGSDTSLYAITDIRIENVRVAHTNTLPLLLSGVRGDASVTNSRFHNTMDPGWIFCERVIAHNLVTTNGSDNGFSISRGNQRVIASNLHAENCAAYGIWIGGFLVNQNSTDYGPSNFNVSNITAINCGLGGVYLDDAPKDGKVTGIYVKGMLRGTPSGDFGDASSGIGIRIGGSPSNDLANQVALATNIEISNFVLIDCAKGGVIVSGAQDVTVRDGMIINPGSLNDYTGAMIVDTSSSENFGIAAKAGSTSKITRFSAHNIAVVDTRTKPLLNYPIFLTGTVDAVWTNLRGVNSRRTVPSDSSLYREFSGSINFNTLIRHVAGTVAGSNAAAGTVVGLGVNGAAGSRRVLGQGQTAGVSRAELAITSDPESGSNAGSNVELTTRTDAGGALHTIWQIARNMGTHVWRRAYVDSRMSQTLAAEGAVIIDAAVGNIQSIALGANATASTIINASVGQRLTIVWCQDALGGHTYAWPAGVKFAGGVAPTASVAALSLDSVTFAYDGTNWAEIGRALAVK
ncbi:hypothetical protein [Arthrobacter sp. UNC362MFTsu5.1]|uniref:hypothetical protein n=1 Tax=Arthrobacter sp. UNC362MFTsu5.1 TaxID=1449044 RepID=UPI0004872EC8|nr:hypothetical protein [Arthrobacter sp. UNC362MFTsu5.1]